SHIAASLSATLSFPEPGDRVLVRIDPVLPLHRGGMGTDAINGGMLAAMFDFVIGMTRRWSTPRAAPPPCSSTSPSSSR
ncbi:MAG TPA: hypothetical protein VFB81_11475, partial [Myxococcales bacterium]|nr:hypothetical protein [Myxococcales bacterium]